MLWRSRLQTAVQAGDTVQAEAIAGEIISRCKELSSLPDASAQIQAQVAEEGGGSSGGGG